MMLWALFLFIFFLLIILLRFWIQDFLIFLIFLTFLFSCGISEDLSTGSTLIERQWKHISKGWRESWKQKVRESPEQSCAGLMCCVFSDRQGTDHHHRSVAVIWCGQEGSAIITWWKFPCSSPGLNGYGLKEPKISRPSHLKCVVFPTNKSGEFCSYSVGYVFNLFIYFCTIFDADHIHS